MYTIKLNNGIEIPCIGIGPGTVMREFKVSFCGKSIIGRILNKITYKLVYLYKKRKFVNQLAHCLKIGYRLIDHSSAYGNEDLITKAIKKSGLKREDIFITTRVANVHQYKHQTRESFMKSLQKMKLNYFDLYMFHWPVSEHFVETYKEIEILYKEGYIKAIGVANCHQHHLEKILAECDIIPALNQFEVHPLFTQKPLIEYCKSKGITIEAYTPLARNDDRLRKNKILQKLARKYNKSIAQIILRWDLQLGIIPIPRSSNPKRQLENISIFDFELTKEEMAEIDSININSRLRFDPDNLDFTSIG